MVKQKADIPCPSLPMPRFQTRRQEVRRRWLGHPNVKLPRTLRTHLHMQL